MLGRRKLRTQDLLDFVNAVAEAFPKDCTKDRFGRYIGNRNTDPLRQLAKKYQTGPADLVTDQLGDVARAIQLNAREIAAIIGDKK